MEITMEEKLRASIDIAAARRAKELTEAAHAAALAIAPLGSSGTAYINLGAGYSPDIVRAFASMHGRQPRLQLCNLVDAVVVIEVAQVSICGVTVCIQGSREPTPEDIAALTEKRQ